MSRQYGYAWNLRDDLAYIVQAREVLLQHSSRAFVPNHVNAAFCRMYMIVMIAYIEHVFRQWHKEGQDSHGIIGEYLKLLDKKAPHDVRLRTLTAAFSSAGILVDEDVLTDYSAILRLRNGIVHSNVKDADKELIVRQGFPIDPAQLNADHFFKMHRTMNELMGYVERAGGIMPSDQSWAFQPAALLTRRFPEPDDRLSLVRLRDLPRMLERNLERISAHIQPDIRRIIRDREYSWHNGFSTEALANLSMSSDELRIRENLAARKASEIGVEALTQHRDLGAVALESWREYWRQLFESRGFTEAKLREAATTLIAAHDEREYNERFLKALSVARAVQQMTRNAGAVGLLAVELPIIDPSRTDEYLEEAERALCAFTLMLYYGVLKSWEDSSDLAMRDDDMRDSQQNIAFYRRMIDAYGGH